MIKLLGFESISEMNKLVANVDISNSVKLSAFKKWQMEDGSKQGLIKLKTI